MTVAGEEREDATADAGSPSAACCSSVGGMRTGNFFPFKLCRTVSMRQREVTERGRRAQLNGE